MRTAYFTVKAQVLDMIKMIIKNIKLMAFAFVSLLITSYNTPHKYVVECLDSIKKQNDQIKKLQKQAKQPEVAG